MRYTTVRNKYLTVFSICGRFEKGRIIMATEKATTAKKPVATLKKAEEAKTPIEKTLEKAEVKKTAVKKTVAKKTAAVKKAAPAKSTKKADAKITLQFSGKNYSTDDLLKIAKDVWVYDFGKKESELKDVELYVKPEEYKVYYVFNKEFAGDFLI